MSNALLNINTPTYIADIAALERNLILLRKLKHETGVKVLLATKAFSMFSVFGIMKDALDGTTASGLYEARLGHTHFGKEIHTYSPAFTEQEIQELNQYSDHIYFNSINQLKKFAPLCKGKQIGLRINPQISQVKNSELYDPSAPHSRFGVLKGELTDEVLDQIDILHVHNLCENMAEDSSRLIDHVMEEFDFALKKVKQVNLGGGHYFTHPDYDIDEFVLAIRRMKTRYKLKKIIIEPGAALVYNAGYLAATVLDVIERETPIAILDTSASAHMPDVLEVPYTPEILNPSGEHTYILGGKTCMAGDVIGTYSFAKPLEVGQKIVFTDMLQYTMVKNTTFNGMPLPDLGILHEGGTYEHLKSFSYDDFEKRLS